ncbi:MAG: PAS domain S-box protein [Deltaproteobacteria bacterium]|nr:PAS domain S-box protein [Deltaproteobacteria bacterium]
MRIKKPTYQELEERLAEAEAALAALRREEVDAVVSEQHILLLRLKEVEQALRENEEFSSRLLANSPNPIVVINSDTSIRYANPAMEKLTGFSKAELVGTKAPYPWWTEETLEKIHKDFEEAVLKRKGAYKLEEHFQTKSGERFFVEITSTSVKSTGESKYYLGSWVDITERKRVEERLLWEASVNEAIANLSSILILPKPIEYISFVVLEQAKRLTSSGFGFVSVIDPQTGYHITSTLTRDIWDICQIENKDIVFKKFTGLWGWVLNNRKPLMTNDPSSDPRSSGTPEGHVPIRRFLSVPALFDRTLVGQISLANSDHDYTERDLSLVERLAVVYALAVQRKRSEEELQKARNELERRVEERTAQLKQEIKERKQTEMALRESEGRLRLLSSEVLSVQEKERKRVASELHDGIGQMLTAVKFMVEDFIQQKGESEAKEQSLKAIIPMVQESIEEVRRIQIDLRPPILDDLGILATIGWFCREFKRVYSAIRIEPQIGIQENEVSAPLKTVIYRVLQEALNNIAKHSRADLVCLILRRTEDKVEMVIQDNGLGFDLKDIKKGFGMGSMRERTELSGGSFSIESVRGKGTAIRVSWPIDQVSV